MIDFNSIPETSIVNLNGGNGAVKANMYMGNNIKIMRAVLESGCSIGKHLHKTSCETIYILEGEAECILDGKTEIVKAGQCHFCPKGSMHEIRNNSGRPLIMFDVVPEQ